MQGKRKGYLILHSIEYLTRLRLRRKKPTLSFPFSLCLSLFIPFPLTLVPPLCHSTPSPPYFISPPTPYFIFFLWTCVFVPINLKIYFHFMRENAVEKKERGKIKLEGRRGESWWRGGEGKNQVGGEETEVEEK